MLAYLYTPFSGFIPCKVLARVLPRERVPGSSCPELLVRLTAARGPYKRGEVLRAPRGDVVGRPLRRSRQSPGRLYSYTIPWPSLDHLPERT